MDNIANFNDSLRNALKNNWSIIPLSDKQPLFAWSAYQWSRPAATQINSWFANSITSYGIICGKISGNLFVLDFDTSSAYQDFQQHFHYNTYTVRTRRGYHVYFAADRSIRSRKFHGGDLKGEGSYVVGEGSSVGSFTYTAINTKPIYHLTATELHMLLSWLHPMTMVSKAPTTSPQTVATLQASYLRLTPARGRNNALYTVARKAKQQGMEENTIYSALGQLHATTHPVGQHPPESPKTRLEEARRTIRSAFHNTPTHLHPEPKVDTRKGIPNTVHEALLQKTSSTIIGRLLQAFRLEGWLGGETKTNRQIIECGNKHHIARSSVMAVLSGKLSKINNNRLIQRTPVGDTENSGLRCKFLNIIPSLDELLILLGTVPVSTPELKSVDLSSRKTYRMALHREIIERLEPECSIQWHAERLNVSTRTINNYNRTLDVTVTPVIRYTPLSWGNVHDLRLYGEARRDGVTPGRWLQDKQGRRFPALQGVAFRRLVLGSLIACERRPSKYHFAPQHKGKVIWRHSAGKVVDRYAEHIDFPPRKREPLQQKQGSKPASIPYFADELLLVKGIGRMRQHVLHEAGIFTLNQLVDTGVEVLTELKWTDEYVTERVIHRWIEDALLLLGKRSLSPSEIAERTWQKQKQVLNKLSKYLKRVGEFEEQLFGVCPTQLWWNVLQHDLKYFCKGYSSLSQEELIKRCLMHLEQYLKRIQRFLALSKTELSNNGFGAHYIWRSRERQTIYWMNRLNTLP